MILPQGRFRAPTVGFCFLVLVATASSACAADKPLKVFILADQSNMQGHANVSTFSGQRCRHYIANSSDRDTVDSDKSMLLWL